MDASIRRFIIVDVIVGKWWFRFSSSRPNRSTFNASDNNKAISTGETFTTYFTQILFNFVRRARNTICPTKTRIASLLKL